jgi:hypothetical protein
MRSLNALMFIFLAHTSVALGVNFKKGHYYNLDGKKIEGLIHFRAARFSALSVDPGVIKFKANPDSKAIKLGVNEILGFVIELDSFTIIENFRINAISGVFTKDFAQIVSGGIIKLYLHRSTANNGQSSVDISRFVISKDNIKYLGILGDKKQRKEIAEYFSGRSDLQDQILQSGRDLPMQELVEDFNRNPGH